MLYWIRCYGTYASGQQLLWAAWFSESGLLDLLLKYTPRAHILEATPLYEFIEHSKTSWGQELEDSGYAFAHGDFGVKGAKLSHYAVNRLGFYHACFRAGSLTSEQLRAKVEQVLQAEHVTDYTYYLEAT